MTFRRFVVPVRTLPAALLIALATAGCQGCPQSTIQGLEVTQAVQGWPGQPVPLIGHKTTIVRVYMRPISGAVTSYRARLTARRMVNGQPGLTRVLSPIPPFNTPTGVSGEFRQDTTRGFVFRLDPDLVIRGELELEAEAFDQNMQPLPATPPFKLLVSFIEPQWFWYYAERYVYSVTGAQCTGMAAANVVANMNELYTQGAYVTDIMPVSSTWFLNNGNPNVVPSFDNADCKGYSRAMDYASRLVDYKHPGGGHRYYLLQPDKGNGYFGWSTATARNNTATGAQNLLADEGPTLAHELTHTWNLWWHTFDNPGPYPRKDGSVGIHPGVRASPTPPVLIPSKSGDRTSRFDILSYSTPYWISDFTYCELMRIISASFQRETECRSVMMSRVAPPFSEVVHAQEPALPSERPDPHSMPTGIAAPAALGAALQGAEQGRSFLYVSGIVSADNTATLWPFEIIASTEALESPRSGDAYRLVLLDGSDRVVAETPFGVLRNSIRDANDPAPFALFVPYQASVRRVQVRRDDRILAERRATPSAPRVELVSSPTGTASGTQRVAWRAQDADGDRLSYSLWYSADDGTRWLPLTVLFEGTAFDVDFDRLPSSERARLRVLASDGFHTSEVRSAASFRVRAPDLHVEIGQVDASDRGGAGVRVTGTAFSWAEGLVTDPTQFTWTVDGNPVPERGPTIVLRGLQPGPHRVALSVTTGAGRSGSATTEVTIAAR